MDKTTGGTGATGKELLANGEELAVAASSASCALGLGDGIFSDRPDELPQFVDDGSIHGVVYARSVTLDVGFLLNVLTEPVVLFKANP